MENNFLLVTNDLEKNEFIDKDLENFYFIDTNQDQNLKLDFELKNKTKSKFVFLVFNNNHHVNLDISCNVNSEKIDSETVVLVYGMNQSLTSVKVSYKLESKAIDSIVDQKIVGVMLSNDAIITGIPNLIVNCIEAKAEHSLKIGALDMDELFYLLCKGFDEKESKNILLKTEINKVIENLQESEKQICLETIKRKLV